MTKSDIFRYAAFFIQVIQVNDQGEGACLIWKEGNRGYALCCADRSLSSRCEGCVMSSFPRFVLITNTAFRLVGRAIMTGSKEQLTLRMPHASPDRNQAMPSVGGYTPGAKDTLD
jgi:hypothetical protein